LSFSIVCLDNLESLKGRALKPFAALFAAVFLMLCGAVSVSAQSVYSSSYITPFPQGDRYQIRVIGDWYGAGLAAGLQDALKGEASLEIYDMSKSSYGLARAGRNGLSAEVDKLISGGPVHAAVFMMGMNDRVSIRSDAGNVRPGTAEWKELYGKEAGKLIKKLRAAGIAVYWVGLPPMSNSSLNEFAAGLNDTIRQAVYLNGAKFVETAAGFTDPGGGYSAWGPDISGQTKRLRDSDGSGLTQAGYRKIASFVEVSIRRDLAQARAQRNIPLAGDEEEQARVVPGHTHDSPAKSATAGPAAGWKPQINGRKPEAASKADNAGLKTVAAAPAPAAPDVSRRDQAAFAETGVQPGEYILADLDGGLTSIAVITPVGNLSMREIQRQTPLVDRLYFRVLSKGEALPAKEGRADDFRWHGEGGTKFQ
jgi:hypothetical protein